MQDSEARKMERDALAKSKDERLSPETRAKFKAVADGMSARNLIAEALAKRRAAKE